MLAAAVGNQGVMVRLQLLPLPLANPELKTGSYTWVAVVARVRGAILLIRILRIVIPLLCDLPITSHCAHSDSITLITEEAYVGGYKVITAWLR